MLPTKPSKPTKVDPCGIFTLLIGEPKWGKSTFAAGNPDALILCFEDGQKFLSGYKYKITGWDKVRGQQDFYTGEDAHGTLKEVIALLQKTKKFKTVVIDTADMMAKCCQDFFVGRKNVEHISDAGDYGKGWDICLNTPFRQAVLAIQQTGRGVVAITHSKKEISRYSAGEVARKETTLPKGPAHFLISQADIVMHGEMGKKRAGQLSRDRILVCGAEVDVLAGNRMSTAIPERYIVSRTNGWEQFAKFFSDPTAAEREAKIYSKHYKS